MISFLSGYNQKVYKEPRINIYPPPEQDDTCYISDSDQFTRQRNVAFQSDYYGSRGDYNTPFARRGSSPRGSYGGGGVSPKFRRTPGASRPSSCGPTFSMCDATMVQTRHVPAVQNGICGAGSGRSTPAYGYVNLLIRSVFQPLEFVRHTFLEMNIMYLRLFVIDPEC